MLFVLDLCPDTCMITCDVLQHKHNPDNNWETPFDFTDENYETVRKHLWKAYSAVLPVTIHCFACSQRLPGV